MGCSIRKVERHYSRCLQRRSWRRSREESWEILPEAQAKGLNTERPWKLLPQLSAAHTPRDQAGRSSTLTLKTDPPENFCGKLDLLPPLLTVFPNRINKWAGDFTPQNRHQFPKNKMPSSNKLPVNRSRNTECNQTKIPTKPNKY